MKLSEGRSSSMPIFISYSQKDSHFVDALARNLAYRRHNIWMDRWELNVGDSLIEKIQHALTASSAILIVLSNHSVGSQWCKKELNAGLMRELDEKKALLMPCVIDDCEIPLFLREKLYADFRADPDKALSDVDRALSRISNTLQARSETPDFHIDWSTSWGTIGGNADLQFIELTFVDHAESWPYVVMSQCKIMCNPAASKSFLASIANGERELYIRDALMLVLKKLKKREMTMLIDSSLPQRVLEKVQINKGEDFLVEFSCRRMGSDNGMDTLYHMDENLRRALEHMNETLYQPQQT
jgi:hypothetical protein